MSRACKNCTYFSKTHNFDFGEQKQCRRYPPISSGKKQSGISSGNLGWPYVREDDWCGEFSEKTLPIDNTKKDDIDFSSNS